MEGRIKDVLLSDVVFDEKIYPRTHPYWQTSYDYANSLRSGAVFPPIVLALHNGKLILVDGKHRTDAFKQCKRKTIPAEVHTDWDENKIFVESIKRNIAHGKVLSPFEKRKCILKLREMKLSNEDISDLIQIPQEKIQHFVGQRLISSTTGDLINFEIVKSGMKHLAGKGFSDIEIQNISEIQRDISTGNQVTLLKQLVNLLENDMINLDHKVIQQNINKLSELIEPLVIKKAE